MLSANRTFWWGKIGSFCINRSVLTATVFSKSSPSNEMLKEKLMAQAENDKGKKKSSLQGPLLCTESRYTQNCKMDWECPISVCVVTPQGAVTEWLNCSFPPFHPLKNKNRYSPHWVTPWEMYQTVLFWEKEPSRGKTSPLGMQEVSSAGSLRCRTELAAIRFTTKHWTKGYTFA